MSALEISAEPAAVGLDAQRLGRVQSHFDRYVEDGRVPGWLATVSRGGELVWKGRGGYRDRERGLEVTDDTLWRIYSMTKPLTSLGAMILYEEGCFDLTSDVGRWIEELREPRVYAGGTPSHPRTIPATGPVRVHHLLTHTSGLTYGFQRSHPVDEIYRLRGYEFGHPDGADLARAVSDWCASPLLFDPGTRWNYSVATDVLGRLIELWSGQPLHEFFRDRILDPLGMSDTDWYCPAEKLDRLAMLYTPHQGTTRPLEQRTATARTWPPVLSGGGGLVSTARDYARFTALLLRGGELEGVRLVSSRTLALMTRNHLPGDVDLEAFAADSFSEVDYAGVGFGLGFSVVIDGRANKSLTTEGTFAWGGAASTLFWVDPAEDLAVSFFTQLLPSGTYPLRRELQQLVYGALDSA